MSGPRDRRPEEAIFRLLDVAMDDTSGARVVRSFILAAWNARAFGGFDPTDMRLLDRANRSDVFSVMTEIADGGDLTEHRDAIVAIIHEWRPEVLS